MKRDLWVFAEMSQCVGGLGWPAALLDFVLRVTICAPTAPHCSHLLTAHCLGWRGRPFLLPSSPSPRAPLACAGVEVRSAAQKAGEQPWAAPCLLVGIREVRCAHKHLACVRWRPAPGSGQASGTWGKQGGVPSDRGSVSVGDFQVATPLHPSFSSRLAL